MISFASDLGHYQLLWKTHIKAFEFEVTFMDFNQILGNTILVENIGHPNGFQSDDCQAREPTKRCIPIMLLGPSSKHLLDTTISGVLILYIVCVPQETCISLGEIHTSLPICGSGISNWQHEMFDKSNC